MRDVNIYKIDFTLAIKTQLDYGEFISLDIENDFQFYNIEVTEISDNASFDFFCKWTII